MSQVILKRKASAPVYIDAQGCPHPDIVLALAAPLEDQRNRFLELNIAYFHSLDAYTSRKLPLTNTNNICFRFNEEYYLPTEYAEDGVTPTRLGYPSYTDVKKDITITADGELEIIDEAVKFWFLNQEHGVDFDGKKFNDNWEFIS